MKHQVNQKLLDEGTPADLLEAFTERVNMRQHLIGWLYPSVLLAEEDKIVVARARRIQQFLSQNTYMAKKFTGVEGSTVPIKETIESFDAIVKGDFDHVAEQAFFNVGGISDVEEKLAQIQKENG